MGIRFTCPNGHKLNVKEHLAGKRGVCPSCGAKVVIPAASEANGGSATAPPSAVGAATADFPVIRDAPTIADTGATSVIISVEPPIPPAQPPAASIRPPAAPPAFDFATVPAAPAPSPVSNYAIRRARNRRLQMQIAVVLLLAVIVLAIVLVWVLSHGPTEPAPAPQSTTHLARPAAQAYVAEAVAFAFTPRDDQVSSL